MPRNPGPYDASGRAGWSGGTAGQSPQCRGTMAARAGLCQPVTMSDRNCGPSESEKPNDRRPTSARRSENAPAKFANHFACLLN